MKARSSLAARLVGATAEHGVPSLVLGWPLQHLQTGWDEGCVLALGGCPRLWHPGAAAGTGGAEAADGRWPAC